MLRRLNWQKENHRRLKNFLHTVPAGSLAVFDWDNTCICGDIGDAVFRYLLFANGLRLDAEHLANLLPDELEGQKRIPLYGQPMALSDVKARIVAAYKQSREKRSAPFREFAAPMLALMAALETHSGAGCTLAYAIIATLPEGYSPRELAALTRSVAREQSAAPLRMRRLATRDELFSFRWRDGIRPYPEMRNLMFAMHKSHMHILISSATQTHIVAAMARLCRFPFDSLIGMESEPATQAQPNWGPGKVANIRACLGREPLFAAGDSPGDIPLLTAFPGTQLRLLIDRGSAGEMASFIARQHAAPGVLVQNANPAQGRFIAS